MLFEQGVHEKTRIFEKGEIVLTLAGCSRMRVGEGSPEKEKYEKWEKTVQKKVSKSYAKIIEKSLKKSFKIDAKTIPETIWKSISKTLWNFDLRTTVKIMKNQCKHIKKSMSNFENIYKQSRICANAENAKTIGFIM